MMTPYKNSATVEKFYKEYKKQQEGDKAFKATKERMEGYSPAKYKRMTQANKKMSELNKKERKLLDDNRISQARKQELQAGIQRQRIAIAKGALGVK
jgi:predicted transcriptional regulator